MLFGISLAMGPGSPTCRGTSWSSASLPMGGPRSVNRSMYGTASNRSPKGDWQLQVRHRRGAEGSACRLRMPPSSRLPASSR